MLQIRLRFLLLTVSERYRLNEYLNPNKKVNNLVLLLTVVLAYRSTSRLKSYQDSGLNSVLEGKCIVD